MWFRGEHDRRLTCRTSRTVRFARTDRMAPKFRSGVLDPILICSQIVCMQCVFYLCASVILTLTSISFLRDWPQLAWLFDAQQLRFSQASGKCIFVSFLLTALCSGLGIWRLVRRTKQCLDFACTIHFWHLIFCILYTHTIPRSSLWWIVNVVSIVVSTVMGEVLCMRSELKVIPLSSTCASGSPSSPTSTSTAMS